jgi:hypothetical protein
VGFAGIWIPTSRDGQSRVEALLCAFDEGSSGSFVGRTIHFTTT